MTEQRTPGQVASDGAKVDRKAPPKPRYRWSWTSLRWQLAEGFSPAIYRVTL